MLRTFFFFGAFRKGDFQVNCSLGSLPNLQVPLGWDPPSTCRIIPGTCKWLGSPSIFCTPFRRPFARGSHNPILRGFTITVVIKSLNLTGMRSSKCRGGTPLMPSPPQPTEVLKDEQRRSFVGFLPRTLSCLDFFFFSGKNHGRFFGRPV